MTTIPELTTTLQELLTSTANTLAKKTGFIRRQRQVTGAGFAQTLVLGGLAEPEATRKQQHQAATQVGMQVSAQGLEQRFTPAAVNFMQALLTAGLEALVSSDAGCPVLPQFNGVYLTDCTRLVWGSNGVKLAVRWELQSGRLQARLAELKQHDQTTGLINAPLPRGALHLGDLGFFKLPRFQTWQEHGVYWLTRFKIGTTVYHMDGEPLDLLHTLETSSMPLCLSVRVGHQAQLASYLVAAPIPATAYTQRMARLREQARLDQRPLAPRQVAFARWTIYLTNIPNLTFDQAHLLARTRWQIELLFKLWKSHGKVLVSRSRDPIRQQCEGYAKLLGVLVAHWLLLVSGWQHDTLAALDALRLVRTYVPLLMHALNQPTLWTALFIWLQHNLARSAPRSKRRQVPLAFQLWQTFDLVLP